MELSLSSQVGKAAVSINDLFIIVVLVFLGAILFEHFFTPHEDVHVDHPFEHL